MTRLERHWRPCWSRKGFDRLSSVVTSVSTRVCLPNSSRLAAAAMVETAARLLDELPPYGD
jgi:hypothetical protein